MVPKLGVSGSRSTAECARGPNAGLKLLTAHVLVCDVRLPTPVQGGCEESPRQWLSPVTGEVPNSSVECCLRLSHIPPRLLAAPSLPLALLRGDSRIFLDGHVRPR